MSQRKRNTAPPEPPAEPATEKIVRLTVDLSDAMHQELSLLAVRQRTTKAKLVRQAIAQLLAEAEA